MSARHPLSIRVQLVAGFMLVALASVSLTAMLARHGADAQFAPEQLRAVRHNGGLERDGISAGALSVLIALTIALVVAMLIARPLQRLNVLVTRLAEGDGGLPLGRPRGAREIRELHAALAQLSADLRTRRDARCLAVAEVRHETRNAVTGILGRVAGLQDGVLTDRHAALAVIEDDAQRLLRQVEGLERFAGDGQDLLVAWGPIDLDEVIRSSVRRHAGSAGAKQIEIECASQGPAMVRGDRERLSQIVDNLLSNALRYTDPSGHAMIRASVGGAGVCLDVADSGIGMAEEDLEHIFDPFWRAPQAQGRVPEGCGVGLTIVCENVAALGGSIAVASAVGVGSSFRIELPSPVERPVHGRHAA